MLTHINTYVIIPNKSTAISVKKRFCAVLFPAKIYRPATHPIILPSVSPDKILRLYCVGGIFFLGKPYLENFMSRPSVIPAFRPTPLQNRGRNFVRSKRRSTYTSSGTLYLFCALTIRKQLSKVDFERRGRGQEPSSGHKFSILENFLSIRDFTFQTLASFPSDLVGACLPQTLLIIRALRHEWNGVSCLHNFTEELSNRQEVQ